MIAGCSGSVLHKIVDVDIRTYEYQPFSCPLFKFFILFQG